MRAQVISWVSLETENHGELELHCHFFSYDDTPEVHEIKFPEDDDGKQLILTDDFDPDDYLTQDDWGALFVINRQEIQEHHIDMAEARADALYDEWKDRQYDDEYDDR